MTRARLVLVHAPLVGPSTWRWVSAALDERGHAVVAVDLHSTVRSPTFDDFVSAVAAPIEYGDVLVGHSGAGALLPYAAADAAVADVRYVFVDAWFPPASGQLPEEASFRASLDERVEGDGLMTPWHMWWGETAMRYIVGDDERRAAVIADTPRLPPTFLDTKRSVPSDWTSAAGGYVLLSEIYRPWADTARSYGWRVAEVPGTHLELVNRPVDVAEAILGVGAGGA